MTNASKQHQMHWLSTRGILKAMNIYPYNFKQWSDNEDEGIDVNDRI